MNIQDIKEGDTLIVLEDIKFGEGVLFSAGDRVVVTGVPENENNYEYKYYLDCGIVLGSLSVSEDVLKSNFEKAI